MNCHIRFSPKFSFCLWLTLSLLAFTTQVHGETEEKNLAPQAAISESSIGPQQVVEQLHATLLSSMQNAKELGFQGRFNQIQPVVTDTFDVEFMGSKSVGRHWTKLSPEDQQLWLEKFVGYISANYAGNFDQYDGETFETLGEKEAQRNTRVVLTELKVPGGEDVIFNYRLRPTPKGWKIIDIYLRGTVSELALRRSDFTAALKKNGFPELTSTVDQKIAKFKEESES
ncbi:MAG: hypothetical protein CL917_12900 [Deltaproteobacteria bacterium]|nr:hypothetical protein [Deltaproteobacteria bacterium]